MMDVKNAELPEAVYGCATRLCAVEVSYPADMLWWWTGSGDHPAGFYCRESEGCLDTMRVEYYGERADHAFEDPDGMIGPTLQEEMQRRST